MPNIKIPYNFVIALRPQSLATGKRVGTNHHTPNRYAMGEKSPILNNPFEEPRWHYGATMDGNLDYSQILEGRRPYSPNLTVVPNTSDQLEAFSAEDVPMDDDNAPFINGLRAVVKEWREKGYPKVNRATREPGRRIAVRVISQFGEESTKVLTIPENP